MKSSNHRLLLFAALAGITLATSTNAAIISTSDSGGTFTVTTNIALAPLGTAGNDGYNGVWGDPTNYINDGAWAWDSSNGFHSDAATTAANPTRIWITWAEDYVIDKIGLVHSEAAPSTTWISQDYQLQSLNPGGNPTVDGDWTDIGAITGNTFVYPEYIIDPVTTSGIRLFITNPGPTMGDNLVRFEEILVQGTPVPEPSRTLLLGLGALALIGRRCRA